MLWSTGGKLALVNVAPEVLEVFAITKLNQVFRINNKDDAGLELEPDETTDTEHDEDPGTESAGVPSRLIPPKPSRSGAVKLPLPRQEPESMQ
jgi:hypothetical protein